MSNIRLLNRFYGIFAAACIGMLAIGVPFLFVRRAGSAAACLTMFAVVGWSWRVSRSGRPQRSLAGFSALAWIIAVTMLFLGTSSTIVVFVMAVAVILAVVVNLRAGVLFGTSYLLAWLAYIVLGARGLAPPPYFVGGPLISWFHGFFSFLLVLLPVPELVSSIRAAVDRQKEAEHHLRDTLASNEAILRHSPVAMGVYESTGRCVMVNQAFATLAGASVADLLAQDFRRIRAWRESGLVDDIVAMLADGEPRRRRMQDATSFRKEVLIDTIMMPIVLGGAPHVLLQFVDYTEQKLGEEALRKSEERLAMALHASSLSIWDFRLDAGKVELDAQWAGIVGSAPDGPVVTTVTELAARTHPEDLDRLWQAAVATLKGQVADFEQEFRIRTDAGAWKWICCSGKVIERDASGRAVRAIGTNIDITSRKLAEEQIRRLAYYDSLTNLPNRRLLLDRMKQALAQSRRHAHPLAIMFLDLDHFKQVNDTLGHDAGDLLLVEVARRLSACARAGDTVSRQGGDEFVILLGEVGQPSDAEAAANKIFRALEPPVVIGDTSCSVTTSIGICFSAADSQDDVHRLLKNADSAMYDAKKSGRNRYCFHVDRSLDQKLA